jgi:hypothetical protein
VVRNRFSGVGGGEWGITSSQKKYAREIGLNIPRAWEESKIASCG